MADIQTALTTSPTVQAILAQRGETAPAPAEGEAPPAEAQTTPEGQVEAPEPVQGEVEAVEKPEGEKPEEKKEEKPADSERLARLAAKESKLVRQQREWKAQVEREKAEIAREREALRQWASLPEVAKTDPLKALESLGLSYDQITDALLSGVSAKPEPAPVKREDVDRIVADRLQKEREEAQRQAQEAAAQEALSAFQNEVSDFLNEKADQYELISLQKADTLVMEVIEAHFSESGELLEISEAAELVEAHLEEEAKRLLQAKKLAPKQQAQTAPTKEPEEPRSLSNALGVSSASLHADGPVSYEDAKERAIAAFHAARSRK